MGKYKKKELSGIVELAKGYKLIVPAKSDNKEIMVAVGMLTQIWALAELESGQCDVKKFKLMLNAYVDKILEMVQKENKKEVKQWE